MMSEHNLRTSCDCVACGALLVWSNKWRDPARFGTRVVCKPCYDDTRLEAHQAVFVFDNEESV